MITWSRELKTTEKAQRFGSHFMKKEGKVVQGGGPDHIYIYIYIYIIFLLGGVLFGDRGRSGLCASGCMKQQKRGRKGGFAAAGSVASCLNRNPHLCRL